MPATFGTGVGTPFTESVPADLGRIQISAGGSDARPAIPAGGVAVLTCIDVTNAGGGSGGFCPFSILDGGTFQYWSINTGSNVDAFEWRGMLPLGEGMRLLCTNDGDNDIWVVYSGLWVPTDFLRL